jgi:hypothetical protein
MMRFCSSGPHYYGTIIFRYRKAFKSPRHYQIYTKLILPKKGRSTTGLMARMEHLEYIGRFGQGKMDLKAVINQLLRAMEKIHIRER